MKQKIKIPGVLIEIKNNSGFKVPDNYFEELPARIEKKLFKIVSDPRQKVNRIKYVILSVAASIIMLLGIYILIYKNYQTKISVKTTTKYLELSTFELDEPYLIEDYYFSKSQGNISSEILDYIDYDDLLVESE